MKRPLTRLLRYASHHPLVSIAAFMGVLIVTMAVGWGFVLAKLPSTQQAYKEAPSPTPTPAPAILEVYSQEVTVKGPRDAAFKKGENGMTIPEGTIVKTGEDGRAQIVFPSGTVTRLDYESEVKLDMYKGQSHQIKIFLMEGRVWSRIKKLLGNELYQTESSSMIATVRGTSYGHGIVEGVFNRGTVTKGKVELVCKNEEGELELEKDETALVDCAKGTGFEALDMSDAFKNDEWILFNKEEDEKLNSRFGADTYDDEEDVLGAATTVTPTTRPGRPTPTFRPTSTPRPSSTPRPATNTTSATNTPVPTATSAPTNTITPSPTPITVPQPIVQRASETAVSSRATAPVYQSDVTIYGENFTPTMTFRIIDPAGTPLDGAVQGRSADGTLTIMTARFSNIQTCGAYTIETRSPGGEFATFTTAGLLTINNCPPSRTQQGGLLDLNLNLGGIQVGIGL